MAVFMLDQLCQKKKNNTVFSYMLLRIFKSRAHKVLLLTISGHYFSP